MRNCKIVKVGYTSALSHASRFLKDGRDADGLVVIDYPAVEKEINRYLAQGYRIVSTFHQDGITFVLESDQ